MTIGSQAKTTSKNQTVKTIWAACHSLTICLIIDPILDISKTDF